MNNDRLSFSEAFRIKQKLMDIGINIDTLIINKSQNNEIPDEVRKEFHNQKTVLYPLSSKGLLGYEMLKEYINTNLETFLDY